MGKILEFICTEGNFLDRTPMAQDQQLINDNLMKLKTFCKAKDPFDRANWQQIGKKKT